MSSEHVPAAARLPFRDPALSTRKRIDDLLGRLTLDERIAMLHQYSPAVPRLGIAAFRTGSEALHGVAWLGPATVFPQAVGLGATWDEELVRAGRPRPPRSSCGPSTTTGRPSSARAPNSLQAWAPVLNLLRDPRWGRNEEGYSEDPVHTARLGVAFCRGLAGDAPPVPAHGPGAQALPGLQQRGRPLRHLLRPAPAGAARVRPRRLPAGHRLGRRHRRHGRLQPGQRPPVPRHPAHRDGAAPLGRADRPRAVRGQRRRGAVQPGRP